MDRKPLAEIYLMPLVVAVIGVGGTWWVTRQQAESSELIAASQTAASMEMARADREVQVIGIVADKVLSDDERERHLAFELLQTLTPDTADRLAQAIENAAPEGQIQDEAVAARTELERRGTESCDVAFVGWSIEPKSPAPGRAVRVAIGVRNDGPGTARDFVVQFHPGEPLRPHRWTVPELGPGESRNLEWVLPSYPKPGEYTARATIDERGVLDDVSRRNNSWLRVVRVR